MKAFCKSFDQTASQFTAGHAFAFTKDFGESFLQYWSQVLHNNTQPKVPLPNTKPTYANLVAKPQGKQKQRLPQQPQAAPQQKQFIAPKDDLRVLIRLDKEAPARNKDSFAIRTHIATQLGISMQSIPAATPTNTGWAIRAADTTTRDLIINTKEKWGPDLGIITAEPHQNWFTYAVAECPRKLLDLWGEPIDYDRMLKEEIVTQTGLTPVRVQTSRRNQESEPTQTLIVSFTSPVPRHWRLFGSSKPARLVNKTDPPHQCDNCWDFHSRAGCIRDKYCKRCGKSGHDYKEYAMR